MNTQCYSGTVTLKTLVSDLSQQALAFYLNQLIFSWRLNVGTQNFFQAHLSTHH